MHDEKVHAEHDRLMEAMGAEIIKQRMRSFSKVVIGVLLLFAFVWVGFTGYFVGVVSQTGWMFSPDFATDAEVIEKIEAMGVAIPRGASRLTYFGFGFEEPSVWISMELAAEERAAMITKWLAKAGVQTKILSPEELPDYDPTMFKWDKHDLARFNFSSWKNVRGVSARDPNHMFEFAAFEETDGDRVVLYFWQE
jgi:hypothetical protein